MQTGKASGLIAGKSIIIFPDRKSQTKNNSHLALDFERFDCNRFNRSDLNTMLRFNSFLYIKACIRLLLKFLSSFLKASRHNWQFHNVNASHSSRGVYARNN